MDPYVVSWPEKSWLLFRDTEQIIGAHMIQNRLDSTLKKSNSCLTYLTQPSYCVRLETSSYSKNNEVFSNTPQKTQIKSFTQSHFVQ